MELSLQRSTPVQSTTGRIKRAGNTGRGFRTLQTKHFHWSLYLALIVACLFIALFISGLENYRRLLATLAIKPGPILQEWTAAGTIPCRAYYIEVVNLSEGSTVEDINVRLAAISPKVSNLEWLPVSLHVKHDNNPGPTGYIERFSLNPREPRHIDLVSLARTSPTITIEHVVADVNKSIPKGRYELTVIASGNNTPEATARFEIFVDDSDKLHCVAKGQ